MDYDAVLFDYGHTLIDFAIPEEALLEAYGTIRDRLLQEASAELPQVPELVERVARQVAQRVEESYLTDRLIELNILDLFQRAFAELGFDLDQNVLRWIAETEHRAVTRFAACSEHTVNTLRHLQEAGLKIGIISNAHLLPHMMREDWYLFGFGQYINASLISSEIGLRKPHPQLFRTVLGLLNVEAERAIFVGDRLFDDVGGAQGVGMKAILTQEFRQEIPTPGSEQPDFVIKQIEEVVPYVLS